MEVIFFICINLYEQLKKYLPQNVVIQMVRKFSLLNKLHSSISADCLLLYEINKFIQPEKRLQSNL
ncbi:hypothetical protein TTHERM_00245600 (macronuclear) [Tetrahymena thermophila SB210]|uniref:Uncharacterized protein n=1 Tax=Tetrahymena thermophila (strain SB210) TaxID=312017 RepID=Q245T9_TETTS|nr:hypothetical protein TTHERM_00245600 [Tetrahymena thermophila SB210]EAS03544.1 hypothetical protein TTHERM_00245600 [Tetrahymena thermophila SB210]|eukprot:XP_001023789.1 hypothetical protein TTHERM_00245600 [Tetrahymena thermophila SB210]